MTKWTIILFLTTIFVSGDAYGQNTPSEYYFVILKQDSKTEMLPVDTLEYTLNLLSEKKAKIFLHFSDNHWTFSSKSQNTFDDFIHYRIIKGRDTMDVLLKYDCSVWSYPNTKTSDTVVFTKGKFIFNERQNLNYWRSLVKNVPADTSRLIEFLGKKYYFQEYTNVNLMVEAMIAGKKCNKLDRKGRRTGLWVTGSLAGPTYIIGIGKYKVLRKYYNREETEWEKSGSDRVERGGPPKEISKKKYRNIHGLFYRLKHVPPKISYYCGEWKYNYSDGSAGIIFYDKNGNYIKTINDK